LEPQGAGDLTEGQEDAANTCFHPGETHLTNSRIPPTTPFRAAYNTARSRFVGRRLRPIPRTGLWNLLADDSIDCRHLDAMRCGIERSGAKEFSPGEDVPMGEDPRSAYQACTLGGSRELLAMVEARSPRWYAALNTWIGGFAQWRRTRFSAKA
jgi:hypothetical protein